MASLLDRLDRELRAAATARPRDAAALGQARSIREEPAEESTGPLGQVILAWLPAGDYQQAVQLWPEANWWPGRAGRCRARSTAGRCNTN